MPKLYEYLGMVIFFYSNEHPPIHIHGRYNDRESKIELVVRNGQVVRFITKPVKGKKPLLRRQMKNFEHLTKKLADEIIQSWFNYFILNKNIVPKKLEGKL